MTELHLFKLTNRAIAAVGFDNQVRLWVRMRRISAFTQKKS
ncbi:MAG TPA: hypothetical protein V6D02_14205 [Candidatus Obscuribacterales bacterium]